MSKAPEQLGEAVHLQELFGRDLADQPQPALGEPRLHRIEQIGLAVCEVRSDRRQVPHVDHVEDGVRAFALGHQPGELGFPLAEVSRPRHDLRGGEAANADLKFGEPLRDAVQHRGLADAERADQQDRAVGDERVDRRLDVGVAERRQARALRGLGQILPLVRTLATSMPTRYYAP